MGINNPTDRIDALPTVIPVFRWHPFCFCRAANYR